VDDVNTDSFLFID